ncbi:MAG: L7Ae/L30e/S12e/Gadd45 family ribosomal protein [Eubacteriales bacterium]
MTEKTKNILTSLGLAKRAGKLAMGTDMACDAVRSGKAKLGVASSSSSGNTKKRIENCFSYYGVKLVYIDCTTAELGAAFGKSEAACVAVTDRNLAELVLAKLER